MIQVIPVETKEQKRLFIDFPHSLYAENSCYVPELYLAQLDLLTPGKHPFYKHSSTQLFLAYKDQKLVGRIAAIWNVNHNAFNEVQEGQWGFFDTINDQEVANALFQAARDWVKAKGGNNIVGPINLTTNDTCGLLVEGFDSPPVAMMPYNFAYYPDLVTNAGFQQKVDLRAYLVMENKANKRSVLLLEKLEERLNRSGITIRQINLKDFKNETEKIREIYNKAWDKNLGFVPMTEDEFNYAAKDMKMIVDAKYALLAEKNGQVVGFALGVPDINQILIKIKRGRLFPTGIFKLLFGLKKVNLIRVLMLGVLDEYRKQGIEACLYGRIIKNSGDGFTVKGAECSWMLEHNYMMNHAIEQINGELYKRYRLYEQAL
ncbi:hypothetical protein LZQ00_00825 [Sphingobacterium sp. SRCM116780]|uniref:hypothetical protein n=1 Tax=Sphingobacterium sp. SRCM116780 TaxID=2907623 RepID=UPI001F2430AE|nr:hypothetical protein [Sphingobacterium sp. SRCM116780]UIR56386.1 hypothetical protein LZQ00_00825 [Sphingobacterium sp. SRCM116780]